MSKCGLSINEIIGFNIEGTAEWRRRKAEEFPDDRRNLEAAEELDRLAEEVEQLDGSNIHQRILKLFDLAEPYYATIGEHLSEEVSSALRSVGFHGGFTGAELLEWYHETLERAVREAIDDDSGGIDAPELEAQVADDPAVKRPREPMMRRTRKRTLKPASDCRRLPPLDAHGTKRKSRGAAMRDRGHVNFWRHVSIAAGSAVALARDLYRSPVK